MCGKDAAPMMRRIWIYVCTKQVLQPQIRHIIEAQSKRAHGASAQESDQ